MTGETRRQRILDKLKESEKRISGAYLAKEFSVSRQIIVQDIALLRASGYPISSTNRGYAIAADTSGDGAFRDGAFGDEAFRDGAFRDGALGDEAFRDGALGDGAFGDGTFGEDDLSENSSQKNAPDKNNLKEQKQDLTREERLEKQFAFCREIDKEKFIKRQTYLSDAEHKENDAEHAWHMAIMTLLLSEYANEEIDVLRTIAMLLVHDLVEIDAGDTYAYDEVGKATQRERELKAADRIFGLLPDDQAKYMRGLWDEFEEQKTKEAKFARTMDNIQPTMLNAATDGKAWKEHEVALSKILGRNKNTASGSKILWDYSYHNFIEPNVKKGRIRDE